MSAKAAKNTKTPAKKAAPKGAKAKMVETEKESTYIKYLGNFPKESPLCDDRITDEVSLMIQACTLESTDQQIESMRKNVLSDFDHVEYEKLGTYIGYPALGKNQKSFKTLANFTDLRSQNSTGLANLININPSVRLWIESFMRVFTHELYLVKDETPKSVVESLDKIKKIQPSLTATVFTIHTDETHIANDYSNLEKLDEMLQEHIENDKLRLFAVKKLSVFFKLLAEQIRRSMLSNKTSLNFKKMMEIMDLTLGPFNYDMRSETRAAMMEYSEEQLASAAEEREKSKKSKSKTPAGKKMTEKDRIASRITKVVAPKKGGKKTAAKKTKKEDDEDNEDQDEVGYDDSEENIIENTEDVDEDDE
jgi:hypothetical protein